jgi:hypothetical protein
MGTLNHCEYLLLRLTLRANLTFVLLAFHPGEQFLNSRKVDLLTKPFDSRPQPQPRQPPTPTVSAQQNQPGFTPGHRSGYVFPIHSSTGVF